MRIKWLGRGLVVTPNDKYSGDLPRSIIMTSSSSSNYHLHTEVSIITHHQSSHILWGHRDTVSMNVLRCVTKGNFSESNITPWSLPSSIAKSAQDWSGFCDPLEQPLVCWDWGNQGITLNIPEFASAFFYLWILFNKSFWTFQLRTREKNFNSSFMSFRKNETKECYGLVGWNYWTKSS